MSIEYEKICERIQHLEDSLPIRKKSFYIACGLRKALHLLGASQPEGPTNGSWISEDEFNPSFKEFCQKPDPSEAVECVSPPDTSGDRYDPEWADFNRVHSRRYPRNPRQTE